MNQNHTFKNPNFLTKAHIVLVFFIQLHSYLRDHEVFLLLFSKQLILCGISLGLHSGKTGKNIPETLPLPNWERFGASQILLKYWGGGSKARQILGVCSCTNWGPRSFGRYWVHVSHPLSPLFRPAFKARVEDPWRIYAMGANMT